VRFGTHNLPRLLLPSLLAVGCAKKDRPDARASASQEEQGVNLPASPSANGGSEPELHPGFSERTEERDRLIKHAVEAEGIKNSRVLAAMRKVPRHLFVPEASRPEAYANRPLPIGYGQTISQPYIVAAMTDAALPSPSDRCLEIGTGSGYQAAVLSELCREVYSIEYLAQVATFGAANLRRLGYHQPRTQLRVGDGFKGWPEAAPFDVILVTAAPEVVPPPLLAQLAVGGRLVIPVGPEDGVQQLERWTRKRPGGGAEAFERETLMGVRFVPFLGDDTR
jgi:protein-L-isoaspartate(D-aspartate) O-methyltransferase